jgi:hypothetical protein
MLALRIDSGGMRLDRSQIFGIEGWRTLRISEAA